MFSLVGVVCCVVVGWFVSYWWLSGLDLFCGFDFGFGWVLCLRC